MKWADDAKLVRIPLEGVSELKIVADNAGNGNASDHASFGDAKFLILNAAPTLSIPKSVSTKVGYPIELNEEYSASDAEDGDLTEMEYFYYIGGFIYVYESYWKQKTPYPR